MKTWSTKLTAIDPKTGKLRTDDGPNVPGINKEDALHYCQTHDLWYCIIDLEVIQEIPETSEGSRVPDWGKAVDYDVENN